MEELLDEVVTVESRKSNKTKNTKTKRGNKKKKEKYVNIFSTNAAQLKGKLDSFKNGLNETNAEIFTVQETHYANKGQFQVRNFEIFEAIRKKAKGGTAIGVHKALKPVLISEHSDAFEMVVVEVKAAHKEIRVLTGYGPQENWPVTARMPFFLALEEEIAKAELAGKSLIIQLDANSKLGPEMIPGDKHHQSDNGRILAGIIERHGLIVGNSLKQCEGLITRKRVTKEGVEESTIDFVIFSADMIDYVETVIVDEKRTKVLTKLVKVKKGMKKVESDHNPIISKLKINWNSQPKKERLELFNLKNKTCQEMFRKETSSEINHCALSSIFDQEGDLNNLADTFLKKLNKIIHKCFKKIRVTEKKDEVRENLFKKWNILKNKDDETSKSELKDVENEIANKYAEEYFEKIKERTKNIDCEDGGLHSGSLWNLKKELFPQSRDPPTAMIDPQTGNLITDDEKIQDAAVFTYTKRLENRPIKENLSSIKDAKELLCEKLLEVARANKTPPWEMKHLDKVLKYLKKNKSRDPHGFCNELFRPEVTGDDLKLALLKLMNRIKQDQLFPECTELCNISSIWKRKGPRNDFDAYRGIFRVTIFCTILDRLIYNDEYSTLDSNLTDCNVGARKQRNIRDNIFVINAIMNSIRTGNEEPVDFQVYDVEKCFDTLWLHEVVNCLFEAGLQNDKLPLLFLENANAQVAVKTSAGLSKRVSINNIIMQGSVWGSICCVVLMDKLGQLAYSNPDLLYYYKGLVATPPLQMVDDVLGIQKCSRKSQRLNGVINTFIELEKLTLSEKKCHNVHVGKSKTECPDLKVHGSKMTNSKQETYLGDKIDQSGLLKPTITSRIGKGFGAISSILAIVNELPLAHWRVEAGLRLREAMLLNGTLFNSEAWQGISNAEVEQLEKVDEALLRGLLRAHAKVPLEALFLETGTLPIRFILKIRRLCYLKTILQRDDEELVREVYNAQKCDPTDGDFYHLVMADAADVNLNIDEEQISTMKEETYKDNVKCKVREAAFAYLKQKQIGHSKMDNLSYEKLKISKYMNNPIFNSQSVQMLFALRTRTVRNIKTDFPGMFPDVVCPLGCAHIDSLPNILVCPVLQANIQTNNLVIEAVKYQDIFSPDIVKQRQVTELYTQCLEIRDKILKSPPAPVTGPMH